LPWVGPPAISADGTKVAYWAATGVTLAPGTGIYTGGKYFVVFGDRAGKSWSGEGDVPTPPVISPDGGKVGYVAMKSRGVWQVVAGTHVGKGAADGKSLGWHPSGMNCILLPKDSGHTVELRLYPISHATRRGD